MKPTILKDEVLESTSKIKSKINVLNENDETEVTVKKSFEKINSWIAEITRSLQKLSVAIKNRTDKDSFKELFEEVGWAEEIPLPYFFELQRILEINGIEEVRKTLTEDIKDDEFLKEIKKETIETRFLVKRKHIILRALERHKSEDYISSVPLLLSQIEGILWDMGQHKRLVEKSENGTKKIDEYEKFIIGKDRKEEKWSLRELAEKLFGQQSKLAKRSSEIYSVDLRHPILHGRKIDYDQDLISAILVLMLFVLIQKIKERYEPLIKSASLI